MCVAALEEGFFEPDGGEYNRNKERQLAEIGREIDAVSYTHLTLPTNSLV